MAVQLGFDLRPAWIKEAEKAKQTEKKQCYRCKTTENVRYSRLYMANICENCRNTP